MLAANDEISSTIHTVDLEAQCRALVEVDRSWACSKLSQFSVHLSLLLTSRLPLSFQSTPSNTNNITKRFLCFRGSLRLTCAGSAESRT